MRETTCTGLEYQILGYNLRTLINKFVDKDTTNNEVYHLYKNIKRYSETRKKEEKHFFALLKKNLCFLLFFWKCSHLSSTSTHNIQFCKWLKPIQQILSLYWNSIHCYQTFKITSICVFIYKFVRICRSVS